MNTWVTKYTHLLKLIILAVLFVIIVLFLYIKFIEYKASTLGKEAIMAQELRERNIDLDKAQVDLVKVIKYNQAILNKLQKEWIKSHNLDIQQYQKLVLLYNMHVENDGKPVITSDNGAIPINSNSVVVVDNQTVKDWKLNYSDFRIDIEANVLKSAFAYTLHQKFDVNVTKAVDERGNGAYFANVFELDNTGKQVGKVVVKDFVVKEAKPSAKKLRWLGAPLQLGIGAAGVNGKFVPQIVAAYPIATYGYTTVDTTWAIGPYVGSNGEVHSGGLWFGYDIGELTKISFIRGIKASAFGGMSTDGYIVGVGISK